MWWIFPAISHVKNMITLSIVRNKKSILPEVSLGHWSSTFFLVHFLWQRICFKLKVLLPEWINYVFAALWLIVLCMNTILIFHHGFSFEHACLGISLICIACMRVLRLRWNFQCSSLIIMIFIGSTLKEKYCINLV